MIYFLIQWMLNNTPFGTNANIQEFTKVVNSTFYRGQDMNKHKTPTSQTENVIYQVI